MLIGITGRIGAGKETLTMFLREKGFKYFETSSLLKEELQKKGLNITRESMQDIGDKLREEQGPGVLMKMFLEKINFKEGYIIDSLRNTGEVEFMRENLNNFILIGVDASQKLRFERIVKRNKLSDPKIWEEFLKIDNRDFFDSNNKMGQQTGKCIELADFKIINNSGLEELKDKIENIWEEIKSKQLN